jgi:hypothetical protein
MQKLANDICRCHDEGCDDRRKCARYMLRNTGGPRTPNASTLFPVECLLDEPCPEMIPYEDAAEETDTTK